MADHVLDSIGNQSAVGDAFAQVAKIVLDGTFLISSLLFTVPLALLISYTVNPTWIHHVEREDRTLVLATFFVVIQLAAYEAELADLGEIMESPVARRCIAAAACVWEPALAMLAAYVCVREVCRVLSWEGREAVPDEATAEAGSQQSREARSAVESGYSASGSEAEADVSALLGYHMGLHSPASGEGSEEDEDEAPTRGRGFRWAGNRGYATFEQPTFEGRSIV